MARSFKTAAAFRQALEQRLKGTAETSGVPLSTLRLKVIIERLLARLFAHADPPWLLKGGYRYYDFGASDNLELKFHGPFMGVAFKF